MNDKFLEEASARLANFAANLPRAVSAVSLGVLSKAPFVALSVRESLIWRTEEVGRGARDMLLRRDVASAILLTRAVAESTALVWRLYDVIVARSTMAEDELYEALLRMLHGTKVEGEHPKAFNILTLVQHLDRHVPKFAAAYDQLSEYAHPNWNGVAGLFSKVDREEFTAYFGRGLREANPGLDTGAMVLATALGLFELAYNRISDEMPIWLAELEPL